MNSYYSKATMTTPAIKGDVSKGTLSISGKSLPEDTKEFYAPLIDWLSEFYNTTATEIVIHFDIEYYNTSTSNLFTQMMKNFLKMSETRIVKIIWTYEEDDIEMKEIGEDYRSMIGDCVVLISKENKGSHDPFKPTEF